MDWQERLQRFTNRYGYRVRLSFPTEEEKLFALTIVGDESTYYPSGDNRVFRADSLDRVLGMAERWAEEEYQQKRYIRMWSALAYIFITLSLAIAMWILGAYMLSCRGGMS